MFLSLNFSLSYSVDASSTLFFFFFFLLFRKVCNASVATQYLGADVRERIHHGDTTSQFVTWGKKGERKTKMKRKSGK
jgi:hypothetical protein